MMPSFIPYLLCGIVFAAAACLDLKRNRIPNSLTLPACATGLAYHCLVNGWEPGGLFALKGLGTGFALLLAPYLMRLVGGGDVKLLAAAGAWLGAGGVVTLFLYGSVAGGGLALGAVIMSRDFETIKTQLFYPALLVQTLKTGPSPKGIPYAVPLAAGYFLYLYTGPLV